MSRNTLHWGRRPLRHTHKHVDVCKCFYSNVMKKIMKCDPCRKEKEDIILELELILNFIGDSIDSEIPMNMDDLNELWQWIDSLLGREE